MRANDHPVNRLARQALVKLGQRPEQQRLYCIQLMRWALESGGGCRELDVESLRESVAILDLLSAAEAMDVLALAEDAPARPGLQPRHLIDKSPRELALSLLSELSAKLPDSPTHPSPERGAEHTTA
jgi:hypothetical protein